MSILTPPSDGFELDVPIVIIGAGAAGLVAALAARDAGAEVLVIEADAAPAGSTALSAGLVPAAGTRFQRAAGIADSAALFAADIQKKAGGENPQALVDLLAGRSGQVIEWLADRFGMPFSLVVDFDYPGHSRRRMHGLPDRAGRELIDRLRSACEDLGIDIICNRRATALFVADGTVRGLRLQGPEGIEDLGCGALVLACNGYGGNREMVRRFMPEIGSAIWFGHDQNRGDAVAWGLALDAELLHLGAYQGHGNVAHPQGILITWAVIAEGGIQVNLRGERFWNESQGYSEAARAVLAQPQGLAWTIFDTRIAEVARQFRDFKEAEALGAIRRAETPEDLARVTGLPPAPLARSLSEIPARGADRFGRGFDRKRPVAPYCAVKVTGALFHTQGGLVIDQAARVRRRSGGVFANLFAAGGAAVGVSGSGDSGYLSGNGLLAATVLGQIAGLAACAVTKKEDDRG